MRFKALHDLEQRAVVYTWMDYVRQAPADLLYPIVPIATWLRAFRQLNVKIRAGGMPSPDCLDRITDLVDEWVHGPASEHGTCSCCSSKY